MAKQRVKKQAPVHEVRYGRIRATIWANETSNGTMHNITVSRIYKDGDDWNESSSFGRDDLLLLAKALNQAHSWIYESADSDE